jgi:hypothetical protein
MPELMCVALCASVGRTREPERRDAVVALAALYVCSAWWPAMGRWGFQLLTGRLRFKVNRRWVLTVSKHPISPINPINILIGLSDD